jgi:hydroxymethylpyrimidine/phosphomethylpyrimidine kinase
MVLFACHQLMSLLVWQTNETLVNKHTVCLCDDRLSLLNQHGTSCLLAEQTTSVLLAGQRMY